MSAFWALASAAFNLLIVALVFSHVQTPENRIILAAIGLVWCDLAFIRLSVNHRARQMIGLVKHEKPETPGIAAAIKAIIVPLIIGVYCTWVIVDAIGFWPFHS